MTTKESADKQRAAELAEMEMLFIPPAGGPAQKLEAAGNYYNWRLLVGRKLADGWRPADGAAPKSAIAPQVIVLAQGATKE